MSIYTYYFSTLIIFFLMLLANYVLDYINPSPDETFLLLSYAWLFLNSILFMVGLLYDYIPR